MKIRLTWVSLILGCLLVIKPGISLANDKSIVLVYRQHKETENYHIPVLRKIYRELGYQVEFVKDLERKCRLLTIYKKSLTDPLTAITNLPFCL
ncbi:hypothetical protein [Planctobacterium marinum]|uniref:hypothetical protein n=1 Tax=Planctobacterium marinum TaxID=1631968 RepID=UPI001E4546CB|nr:hypothetical protein [Planctobacterium marinum]MCC2607457.1 hypothetical protein [Planctobacterium marinum]